MWIVNKEDTPADPLEYECQECGKPIYSSTDNWCSQNCFEASLI